MAPTLSLSLSLGRVYRGAHGEIYERGERERAGRAASRFRETTEFTRRETLGKSSKLRMEKHPSRKSLFHGEFMRAEYGTRVTQFIYRVRATFVSFLVAFKRIQKSFFASWK